MASNLPPAGMRDFLPVDLKRRDYALGKIRSVYERHHFQPIETPVLERLETLLGKYGEEGDQLMFKVLKRGEKLTGALEPYPVNPNDLTDMGLRFDLTVPLCRVVAQYRNELPPIFKCYQIRPVWRADRPAKGRFREFYQCDVDIVGTRSSLAEVDVITAATEALRELGLADHQVRINDRRLLSAMTRHAGIDPTQSESTLVSLDKLDKIGRDGVIEELSAAEIRAESIQKLFELVDSCILAGKDSRARLAALADALQGRASREVVENLDEIFSTLSKIIEMPTSVVFEPSLARGLSYYTGPIYEISLQGYHGSVGGGGRYDELIEMFLGRPVPACGISLGIERILMIMEQRDLFEGVSTDCDLFVTRFPDTSAIPSLRLATDLRRRGFVVNVHPEFTRLKRQFSLAEKIGARVVMVMGPEEIENGQVTLKQMATGEQITLAARDVVGQLDRWLG